MGVPKDIPQADIQTAYRKRVKQFHPDLHPDDPKAKAKFQALNEANAVLSDPENVVSMISMANNGSKLMLLSMQELQEVMADSIITVLVMVLTDLTLVSSQVVLVLSLHSLRICSDGRQVAVAGVGLRGVPM